MREVNIKPLPENLRGKRFKPLTAPIFSGPPTREEIELALALFEELDAESQEWYGGAARIEGLRAKLR